jgi:hypothetical protein
MGRSEIRFSINRPLKEVFEIYTQRDPWRWSDLRSVRWTSGEPWQLESRLRIEPNESFGIIVDQVVTHFERYRRVDFISHFGGITMTSQINFRALSDAVAEVYCQLEFIGTFSRIAGFAVGPAIEDGTRRFYEQLKRACENSTQHELPETAANPGRMESSGE